MYLVKGFGTSLKKFWSFVIKSFDRKKTTFSLRKKVPAPILFVVARPSRGLLFSNPFPRASRRSVLCLCVCGIFSKWLSRLPFV